jgi:hypothetical protein
MLPVYLGKVDTQQNETHIFKTSGDCFRSITIAATFTFEKPAFGKQVGSAIADITFDLEDPYSTICMEHFLVGTPFQDIYDFYLTRGKKQLQLEFTESHHLIDLITNGLKFFAFCAEDTSILSSLL